MSDGVTVALIGAAPALVGAVLGAAVSMRSVTSRLIERIARVETKVDAHGERLARVETKLDRAAAS